MKTMTIKQQHREELKNRSAEYRHKKLIAFVCKLYKGHVVKEEEVK